MAKAQEPKVPLTEEEQRRNARMERVFTEKQSAMEKQSFKYLDIFEQQSREHKLA